MKAVIYASKSSPDDKGSVADQQEQVRRALPDDREVIGVFGEENVSGYRKERGPELEAAMRAAIEAAHQDGEAELWVFHSSRLARGDGRKGRRSVGKVVHDLLYEDVIVRSVADPEMVSPMLAGIASKTSNQYAADLSAHVKRGMRQRKEAGGTMGPVAYGYRCEPVRDESGEVVIGRRGKVVMKRVPDPVEAPLLEQAFERFASDETSGDVARWLNSQGQLTRKDKPFRAESVNVMIRNRDLYVGGRGYPRIISDDLARRAYAALKRDDPAANQRRVGGRPRTNDEPYVLKGVAFCSCGEPLYCTRKYLGGKRAYVCKTRLLCLRTCDRPPIPADYAEAHVLRHLDWFVGDVEAWISSRLDDRNAERTAREGALSEQVKTLADLDRQRERHLAEYRKLVDQGSEVAYLALEEVARIDSDRDRQERTIRESEAKLEEWTAAPDVDAVLDFYSELVALIQGRIRQADGAMELNAALAHVLAGIWMWLDPDPINASGVSLRAEFALCQPVHPETSFLGHAHPVRKRVDFSDPLPSAWVPKPPTELRPSR